MMAGPTQDQINDVTFESGVDASGNIAATAFADWTGYTNNNTVPTYDTTKDIAGKWDNSPLGTTASSTGTPGTSSGIITYSFGSGVTASQQTAFVDTLTLWSDEAGLTFQQSTNSTTADVLFTVNTGNGTYNQGSPVNYDTVGSPSISSFLTPTSLNGGQDQISFDTSGGYGAIGDFSTSGGYGVGALTHEVGHMIGLGHAGPYNDGGGVNPGSVQYNEYDSRQWSIMSYIDPSDTTARYYNQYTVTGTSWTSTQGNVISQVAPETPMIDDILAAQRLYGTSSSTALAGGQVFGFNCNITDGSEPFFDFTKNVNPVITIYDSGTNNTLDCSGFSTNCTINLNPGTFSTASAGTLTNNIGIAYNTKIDKAIGGSGTNTFTVNTDNDTIIGGSGSNTVVFSGARSGYTVTKTGSYAATVTNTATNAVDTVSNIQTLQFSDQSVALACYATGTRIRTAAGDVPVERLKAGDLVETASGALRPIRWIGHRSLDLTRWPAARPVRIAAGAFAEGLPSRGLLVSPGHALCIDVVGDALVPAGSLVNGSTIAPVAVDEVTYWHVELDTHDILIAEGLPAESYLDSGNRDFFVESAVVSLEATPDAPAARGNGCCRPYRAEGPLVDAARARLDRRAEQLALRDETTAAA